MFGPQLLLVVALAVFTAALVRARLTAGRSPLPGRAGLVDGGTLRGLALIGAAGLGLLALAMVTVRILGRPGQAESIAVIGLFGYAAYLALMVLLSGWLSRR